VAAGITENLLANTKKGIIDKVFSSRRECSFERGCKRFEEGKIPSTPGLKRKGD